MSGFTSADLDRLPRLPPHTELLDGSLVFACPRNAWHSLITFFLRVVLRSSAPEGWRVTHEMTAWLDNRNRPEPDVLVVAESASRPDLSETFYRPEDIALAIEIVSPESVERDHEIKPPEYARAGIKNLWLIERDGEGMIAYVYTLDPLTGDYSLTGTFGERLKVSVPFDIDIDFGTLGDYR
ncbi:Uma2 family endonuclease [Catenulispora sp. MAP5-51]